MATRALRKTANGLAALGLAALVAGGCTERMMYGDPPPNPWVHERSFEPRTPAVLAIGNARFQEEQLETCSYPTASLMYPENLLDLGGCLPTFRHINNGLLWALEKTAAAGHWPLSVDEAANAAMAWANGVECRSYDREYLATRTDPQAVMMAFVSLETSPRYYRTRAGCREVRSYEDQPDWTARPLEDWRRAAEDIGFTCTAVRSDASAMCRLTYEEIRTVQSNPEYLAENPDATPIELRVKRYGVEIELPLTAAEPPVFVIRSVQLMEDAS